MGAPALLSPAPGSTGLPTTLGVLIFAGSGGAGISVGSVTLTGGDGSTVSGPLVVAPDGASLKASISTLRARTTYDVHASGIFPGGYCDTTFAGDAGSFTTQ